MDKENLKTNIRVVLLFVLTMIGAFFVLLLSKLAGKRDWSRD